MAEKLIFSPLFQRNFSCVWGVLVSLLFLAIHQFTAKGMHSFLLMTRTVLWVCYYVVNRKLLMLRGKNNATTASAAQMTWGVWYCEEWKLFTALHMIFDMHLPQFYCQKEKAKVSKTDFICTFISYHILVMIIIEFDARSSTLKVSEQLNWLFYFTLLAPRTDCAGRGGKEGFSPIQADHSLLSPEASRLENGSFFAMSSFIRVAHTRIL